MDKFTKLIRDAWSKSEIDVIEVNLENNSISWVNDSFSSKCNELVDKNIESITLPKFKDKLSSALKAIHHSKSGVKTLWPILNEEGVSWWLVELVEISDNKKCAWFKCELSSSTETSGYVFNMNNIASESLNSSYIAISSINRVEKNLKSDISEIKDSISSLKAADEKTKDNIQAAIKAAEAAESAAIANKDAIDSLKDQVTNKFDQHMHEITKLISTDAVHDERMRIFEERVKNTTSLAVKSIITQADKAGRGMSKKVTIPVGIIATILTIIQWLITNYKK